MLMKVTQRQLFYVSQLDRAIQLVRLEAVHHRIQIRLDMHLILAQLVAMLLVQIATHFLPSQVIRRHLVLHLLRSQAIRSLHNKINLKLRILLPLYKHLHPRRLVH